MGACTSKSNDKLINHNGKLDELTYVNTPDITYNFTEAKVLKVYDGDTITIGAFYDNGFKKFNVRLYGIDCDELKGGDEITKANALRAKRYTEKHVFNKIVKIDVLNNKIIDGKKHREKFGRLLARITTPEGYDLSNELFLAGLARKYYGGKKDNLDSIQNE